MKKMLFYLLVCILVIMRQSTVKRMMINSMIKTVTELTKVAISTVYLQRNKV